MLREERWAMDVEIEKTRTELKKKCQLKKGVVQYTFSVKQGPDVQPSWFALFSLWYGWLKSRLLSHSRNILHTAMVTSCEVDLAIPWYSHSFSSTSPTPSSSWFIASWVRNSERPSSTAFSVMLRVKQTTVEIPCLEILQVVVWDLPRAYELGCYRYIIVNGGYSFTVCLILYTLASQYVRHLYHKTLYCQGPLHNNKHIVKAWIHLRVITINAICVELEQEHLKTL